jgi:putative membrane protein
LFLKQFKIEKMQKWLLKILVCAVNVFILAYILPGIEIKDMFTALIVAVVLSFLDAIVKPLLILLTLPATILTLGLFLFVINACIILIDAHFVGGFKVESFWHALLFSILLSFFNSFIHKKAWPEEKEKKNTTY